MLLKESEISINSDFNKKPPHLYKALLKKQTTFKLEMPETTDDHILCPLLLLFLLFSTVRSAFFSQARDVPNSVSSFWQWVVTDVQ